MSSHTHINQTQCNVPCMLNVDCRVYRLESQRVIKLIEDTDN